MSQLLKIENNYKTHYSADAATGIGSEVSNYSTYN
jgi:hypothetical protein